MTEVISSDLNKVTEVKSLARARTMIPEAVLCGFATRSFRKLFVSWLEPARKILEIRCKNLITVFGCKF